MTTLTKATAKVVLAPVAHESGGRVTHTTLRAYLVPRTRDLARGDKGCEHTHGHKTTEAAKACGVAMWKRLP